MNEYKSQIHVVYECKYHIVFIPKYRRKTMYKKIRSDLGAIFKRLIVQKNFVLEEGKIMPDHVQIVF